MMMGRGLIGLVAFSAICLNIAAAQEDEDEQQCHSGWVRFGYSCYGFGEDYVSWAGASSLCQIFDGSLAEVDSAEENEFLKNHSRSKGYGSLWVGGTDIFSEGYWTWVGSKRPVQDGFTDWAPGEPNHLGGDTAEDCMMLYAPEALAWNDIACSTKSPFVCEVQLEA